MVKLSDESLEQVMGGSKLAYLVQPGDTLGDLAKRFNCTIDEICKWNNIDDPNIISIDQKLIFKF